MRRLFAVALMLPLILPPAAAGGAGLELVGPTDAVAAPAGEAVGVPIRVHVVLADTVCGADADLVVRLAAYAPGSADVSMPESVVVHVPAGGYVAQPYEADADATMMLTVADGAQGRVNVMAGYDVPSSCVTNGESSASAQMQVRYQAQTASAPPAGAGPLVQPPAKRSAATPSEASPSLAPTSPVVWALGIAVVALLFWILGRAGRRGARDGDELS